jgi:serine/threonine protein kinase
MHHLHAEGIIHGDLKCGNVLLKAELQAVHARPAQTHGAPHRDAAAQQGAVGGGTACGSSAAASQGAVGGVGSSGARGASASGGVRHEEVLIAKVRAAVLGGVACARLSIDGERYLSP